MGLCGQTDRGEELGLCRLTDGGNASIRTVTDGMIESFGRQTGDRQTEELGLSGQTDEGFGSLRKDRH